MEKSRKWRRRLLRIVSVLLLMGFVIFIGMLYWMYYYANEITDKAKAKFHKNNTESLMLVLSSSEFSLSDKNKAIEVLGTFKDQKALPVLESLITHQPCNHSMYVCQYEVEKAILKIKGEYAQTQTPFNAFLYKVTDGMVRLSYVGFSL